MMGGEGTMAFGGIYMWLFWIVLIVVIVAVVRAMAGGDGASGASQRETPLEILEKRYARGEIDEAEYERRRRELEDHS
ncbi:MAG TPA: SHOCT domain-containing protein [Gammaproteobacteria bacterium]|nr:SHOCT domain-containing protein [Gammaproteobacteria bacterium]